MTAPLCAAAIYGETAVGLAWTLLALNVAAAAVVWLSLWICELADDRKPFGPLTEVADVLGFLDERTPQGRFVRRLRSHGLFDQRRRYEWAGTKAATSARHLKYVHRGGDGTRREGLDGGLQPGAEKRQPGLVAPFGYSQEQYAPRVRRRCTPLPSVLTHSCRIHLQG